MAQAASIRAVCLQMVTAVCAVAAFVSRGRLDLNGSVT